MILKAKRLLCVVLMGLVSVWFANALWLPQAQAAELTVIDAYARATPPGVVNSAAYLTINNNSANKRVLVRVTSSRAAQVMLHQNQPQGDMMRMRSVSRLEIAAHSQFQFLPGGHHLMLMGLSQPLRVGEQLDLTLEFEKQPVIKIEIPVTAIEGSEQHSMPMGTDMKSQ